MIILEPPLIVIIGHSLVIILLVGEIAVRQVLALHRRTEEVCWKENKVDSVSYVQRCCHGEANQDPEGILQILRLSARTVITLTENVGSSPATVLSKGSGALNPLLPLPPANALPQPPSTYHHSNNKQQQHVLMVQHRMLTVIVLHWQGSPSQLSSIDQGTTQLPDNTPSSKQKLPKGGDLLEMPPSGDNNNKPSKYKLAKGGDILEIPRTNREGVQPSRIF